MNSILLVRFVVSRNNYHLSGIKINVEHFYSADTACLGNGFPIHKRAEKTTADENLRRSRSL